jgi:D-3-phosphoglycerate dehydrogenase
MTSTQRSPRVVIAESFAEQGMQVLREGGIELESCVGSDRAHLVERLRDAQGLIVRSETRVDRELLAGAPQLNVVARAGVGVDAIDVEAATAAGIVVVNAPAANTLAATELTFALMLAALRNLSAAHALVREGRWERKQFIGRELFGKTLGIVGLGPIGSAVASRAAAFGMKLLASDPFVPPARARAMDVELVDLATLLARSDIVTLHVPSTPQTKNMIDAAALASLRDGALLVNCARGAIVDPDALLLALDSGRLFGAAIDVVAEEPPPAGSASARLLRHPRVVATPHLGGSTYEAQERIALELARDVVNVLMGRPARGAVNVPRQMHGDVERAGAFADLAFRMGRLFTQIIPDALKGEIALGLQGETAELDAEPFVAAVLAGALALVTDRRVSMANARAIGGELGVQVAVERDPGPSGAIALASAGHRIVGTVTTSGPRIVEIDGFEIDAIPEGPMLLTRHRDVPGMVGRIGTILGEADVNISTMQVARRQRGGAALMILEVDREPGRDVLAKISAVNGVDDARSADV